MLHVPKNIKSEPKIGNPVDTAVVAKGGGSAVLALTKCGAAVTGCGIKGQEFPGGGEGAAAKLGEGRPSWEGRQPWQWAVLQAACKHPFCSAASSTAQGAQNSTAVASSSSGATMQPSMFLWCTLSQQSVPFLWNGCVCGVFLLMNGDTFSLLGRGDSGTTQNHNTNSYCPELEGGDWQNSSLAARTTQCNLDAWLPWTKSSAGWTGFIFFPLFFPLLCPSSVGTAQGNLRHDKTSTQHTAHNKTEKAPKSVRRLWLEWTLDRAHSKPSVISLPIYHSDVCNSPWGDFLVFKQLLPSMISSCSQQRNRGTVKLC